MFSESRFTLRGLLRSRGFTLAALLTLALGVGVNIAVLSVAERVLWKRLALREPQRLVLLSQRNAELSRFMGGRADIPVSAPDFVDWVGRQRSFSSLTAWLAMSQNLGSDRGGERIGVVLASPNLFATVGVNPALGRGFQTEEGVRGQNQVVVISQRLWQTRFLGDPQMLGRSITLDQKPFTVVGVAAPGFRFPDEVELAQSGARELMPDAWIPLVFPEHQLTQRGGMHNYAVVARLRDGVSLTQARDDMQRVSLELAREYPESNTGWTVGVDFLSTRLAAPYRAPMLLCLAAAGLLLTISAVNLVNLWLTRALDREKDSAIRLALGASRVRLAASLLGEATILGLGGGALGFLLAGWTVELLAALAPGALEAGNWNGFAPRLLGISTALALLAALIAVLPAAGRLFAVQPARATQVGVGRAVTSDRRTNRLRSALVGAQFALTLLLLTAGGLLARSFAALLHEDPGFHAESVLTARLSPDFAHYRELPVRSGFYAQVLARLEESPRLEHVGLVSEIPLSGRNNGYSFRRSDADQSDPKTRQIGACRSVSADYFATVGIPLLAGRPFQKSDDGTAPPVVILNHALAHTLYGDENPVGRQLLADGAESPLTIVGVVGDVRHDDLARSAGLEIYRPFQQFLDNDLDVVVRSHAAASELSELIRAAARAVDSGQPVYAIRSLETLRATALAPRRFTLVVIVAFSLLALTLAAIGLYGVLAVAVVRRTGEIGIRMALGADRSAILKLILGQSMTLVGISMLFGIVAAFASLRVMQSLLYGVRVWDPLTLGAVALLLGAVALLASWLPARRAARIDPMEALRSE